MMADRLFPWLFLKVHVAYQTSGNIAVSSLAFISQPLLLL